MRGFRKLGDPLFNSGLMRRLRLGSLIGSGGGWRDISVPNAAFSFLPFTTQQNGRLFRPAPSFDLRTHANITVAKEYYVDGTSGNDAATGADWAHALLTPEVAWQKADVDRVYLRNGYWFRTQVLHLPTRSIEVIGDGTSAITADVRNVISAFSAVSNHYEATVGSSQTVGSVHDTTILDTFGYPTLLTAQASVAAVDANAGSWYQNGTALYVRLADDRPPDANIRYMAAFAFPWQVDNQTIYFQDVVFHGATRFQNNSVAGGLKAYFKNCHLKQVQTVGVDEAIFQDCVVESYGEDAMNHDKRNGIVGNVIEIGVDANSRNRGTTSGQASTIHNGLSIARIGGKYHHATGQAIADIGGGSVWMAGTEFYEGQNGTGFYSACNAWLDCCWSHDNDTYDLENTAGTTIYLRDFIGEKGANNIGGTLAPY